MMDATPPRPDAIPAATLIVMRERAGGPPDLLMVQRSAAMAFAAGALVFPGGRIDPADRSLAADDEESAARVAAIRETLEEAGVAIGIDVAAGRVVSLRAALAAGEPFDAALTAAGATLVPDAVLPFARWCPAHRASRAFDTRFYLARLPAGAAAASVDGTENDWLIWASARDVLAQADAGAASVIFPTRRILERLARFTSFEEAAADAGAYPATTVTPWEEQREGEAWLCIPDGLGYPVTAERMTTTRRG